MMGTANVNTREANWFDKVASAIEARFGFKPSANQRQALRRAFEEGALDSIATEQDWSELVTAMPFEHPVVQRLIDPLTINESYFFRDTSTVQSLREVVLPAVIERAASTRVLRVWSAGCAAGEELYTIAILLREVLPDPDSWKLRLVGTDVDLQAVARARQGVYGPWALRATTEFDRERYFRVVPNGYRLRDEYREGVSFEPHNLADEAAAVPRPGEFDLVLCRNVGIYFSVRGLLALHRQIARALSPRGVWIAAPSDPLPGTRWATRVLPGLLHHSVVFATRAAQCSSRAGSRIGSAPHRPPRSGKVVRPRAVPRKALQTVQPPPESKTLPPADDFQTPSALLDSARALVAQGRADEALNLVSTIVLEHPLLSEGHLLLSLICEELGMLPQASQALRRLAYLEPRDAEAHLRLGLVLSRLGDSKGARRNLRNALVLSRKQAPGDEPSETSRIAISMLQRLRRAAE